jgi:hypothetical protein
MSRKLDDILAALPEDQRQRVEARADELRQEAESQRDPSRFDWSRVEGMSEAEIEAAALADSDAQPWTAEDFKTMKLRAEAPEEQA